MFPTPRSEGSCKSSRKALKLHFNALVPKEFMCVINTGAALKIRCSPRVCGSTHPRNTHPSTWSRSPHRTSVPLGCFSHFFSPHCWAFCPFRNTFSLRPQLCLTRGRVRTSCVRGGGPTAPQHTHSGKVVPNVGNLGNPWY